MDPFHTRQDVQNNMFSKPFDSTHAMTGVSFSNPHKSAVFSKGGHLVIANKSGFQYIVASELKDPICHSNECQIGSFSSEATI